MTSQKFEARRGTGGHDNTLHRASEPDLTFAYRINMIFLTFDQIMRMFNQDQLNGYKTGLTVDSQSHQDYLAPA